MTESLTYTSRIYQQFVHGDRDFLQDGDRIEKDHEDICSNIQYWYFIDRTFLICTHTNTQSDPAAPVSFRSKFSLSLRTFDQDFW